MVKGSRLGHKGRLARGRLSNPRAWAGVKVVGYRGRGLAWTVIRRRRRLVFSGLDRCLRGGGFGRTRFDAEQGAVARKHVERKEDGERDGARGQENRQLALQALPGTGLRAMSKERA